MFFIFGVSTKKDKLDFNQNMICPGCGRYGRYEVTVEYTCFSLFFIPILKWDKKYYVKSSCCGSIYLTGNDIGDKISRGGNVNLVEKDLKLIRKGKIHSIKQCESCGFKTDDDFQYCPKCGVVLEGNEHKRR